MDLETKAEEYGRHLGMMAAFTAIGMLFLIGSFWLMNQTGFFSVDISLFLKEFGVPYFLGSFLVQIFNNVFQYLVEGR